jgi:hypothetical protein
MQKIIFPPASHLKSEKLRFKTTFKLLLRLRHTSYQEQSLGVLDPFRCPHARIADAEAGYTPPRRISKLCNGKSRRRVVLRHRIRNPRLNILVAAKAIVRIVDTFDGAKSSVIRAICLRNARCVVLIQGVDVYRTG